MRSCYTSIPLAVGELSGAAWAVFLLFSKLEEDLLSDKGGLFFQFFRGTMCLIFLTVFILKFTY